MLVWDGECAVGVLNFNRRRRVSLSGRDELQRAVLNAEAQAEPGGPAGQASGSAVPRGVQVSAS